MMAAMDDQRSDRASSVVEGLSDKRALVSALMILSGAILAGTAFHHIEMRFADVLWVGGGVIGFAGVFNLFKMPFVGAVVGFSINTSLMLYLAAVLHQIG